MNPLSGGLIPQHEKEIAFLADDNETPTQAALRFCINCPQITITLVGFTTREHIDMACSIADNAKHFTEGDINRIRDHVSERMNALCTGCGYCMKCCPENIPITEYTQAYNEKPLFNRNDKEMVNRIKAYHWNLLSGRVANAGDCIECAACEEVCTQHLNIIERLKEIDAWEQVLNKKLSRFLELMKKVKRKIKSFIKS